MKQKHSTGVCEATTVQAIYDTLDVLRGKWTLPIIGALLHGSKRFRDLERLIPKITPKMLSKELRALEVNQLVRRRVYDTLPVSIEYEITEHGHTLREVIQALYNWGAMHRRKIIYQEQEPGGQEHLLNACLEVAQQQQEEKLTKVKRSI
jgi:DNA-binding HxlR family transcriptional regulator